jgi:hypothetical protein
MRVEPYVEICKNSHVSSSWTIDVCNPWLIIIVTVVFINRGDAGCHSVETNKGIILTSCRTSCP